MLGRRPHALIRACELPLELLRTVDKQLSGSRAALRSTLWDGLIADPAHAFAHSQTYTANRSPSGV